VISQSPYVSLFLLLKDPDPYGGRLVDIFTSFCNRFLTSTHLTAPRKITNPFHFSSDIHLSFSLTVSSPPAYTLSSHHFFLKMTTVPAAPPIPSIFETLLGVDLPFLSFADCVGDVSTSSAPPFRTAARISLYFPTPGIVVPNKVLPFHLALNPPAHLLTVHWMECPRGRFPKLAQQRDPINVSLLPLRPIFISGFQILVFPTRVLFRNLPFIDRPFVPA